MRRIYQYWEKQFERISSVAMRVFGSSIAFTLAIALIIFWFSVRKWDLDDISSIIRDIILTITFLSFFIIQRWFNKFSQILHLKLNELIMAHENARNHLVNAEEKTEAEIHVLAKEHDEIAEKTKTENQ